MTVSTGITMGFEAGAAALLGLLLPAAPLGDDESGVDAAFGSLDAVWSADLPHPARPRDKAMLATEMRVSLECIECLRSIEMSG
jgi:hypothetical protein